MPDFSKYTNQELLEILDAIDAERYPERKAALDKEIAKREQAGSFNRPDDNDKSDFEFFDNDDDDDFILEFSAHNKASRIAFLSAMVLLPAALIAFLLPKYFLTDIQDVHKYSAEIEQAKCHEQKVWDEEERRNFYYYDLELIVYPQNFWAMDISKSKCQQIAQQLKHNKQTDIWHEQGIIRQLGVNQSILLSDNYLAPKIRSVQTADFHWVWFLLVVTWLGLGKSTINAIWPGTFQRD